MASLRARSSYRPSTASGRQHGVALSNDSVYLLGLLNAIDSDGNFEGYIDLDDSMQPSIDSQDDKYNSTQTLDEDNCTQTINGH